MKKTAKVSLVIIMILVVFSISSEALSYTITPYWANMNSITMDIYFSGANSIASALVEKVGGVTTLLSGSLTLYRKSGTDWIYVSSTSSASTRTLALTIGFSATSGVQYKSVLNVTAYSATGSESETVTKISTCP